jgi:hypothetical protein
MAAGKDEQSYEGGCHCGAVRFRVLVREHEALECNCSRCAMNGFLHLIVPPADFELLAGGDQLAVYRFNTRVAVHRFCRSCGIQPFYTPRSHPDMVDVNVRCLDGDVRSRFRTTAFDGRDWEQHVAEIR